MRTSYIFTIFALTIFSLNSQSVHYQVELEPIEITEIGGIQSYAFGTHNGEWLIIGGRLDGLHQRQPFAAFDSQGRNNQLIVINPETKEVWKQGIENLPVNVREQLGSTNMQFYQEGEQLLLTGGYAFSPSQNDHITFPFLTIVNIPSVIKQVKEDNLTSEIFIQSESESFRLAGGRLGKINDTYQLVGGHKFMGRYNPMGPDHGPGFIQAYSHEIRRFTLNLTNGIEVDFLAPFHDEMHLRRRDYNLVPQIINNEYGLTIFSGVFQKNADLPWLYPVNISSNNYEPIETFKQYFNHYHCATLPIYNSDNDEMHTLFFGGIAQFYKENNTLVQDNDVPFVNTIADVVRTKDGTYIETKLDSEMPGLLGAGSEFILTENSLLYDDGIIDGDKIDADNFKTIGYIFGGIRSSLPNIFWINTGTQSEASNTLYKVSIKKVESTTSIKENDRDLNLFIYPNPAQNFVRITFDLVELVDVDISVFDTLGRKVHAETFGKFELKIGQNFLVLNNAKVGFGAYYYKVSIDGKELTRKVIWTE